MWTEFSIRWMIIGHLRMTEVSSDTTWEEVWKALGERLPGRSILCMITSNLELLGAGAGKIISSLQAGHWTSQKWGHLPEFPRLWSGRDWVSCTWSSQCVFLSRVSGSQDGQHDGVEQKSDLKCVRFGNDNVRVGEPALKSFPEQVTKATALPLGLCPRSVPPCQYRARLYLFICLFLK